MKILGALRNRLKNDLFLMMLSSIAALIVFVILIQFVLTYTVFLKKSADQHVNSVQNDMLLARKDIEEMFADIRNQALSAGINSTINSLFYQEKFSAVEKRNLKTELTIGTQDYIKKFFIYNDSGRQVSDSDVIALPAEKSAEWPLIERMIQSDYSKTGKFDTCVYTNKDGYQYISTIYYPVKGSKNAIIINCDSNTIFRLISRYSVLKNKGMIIAMPDGTVIYGGADYSVGENICDETIFSVRNEDLKYVTIKGGNVGVSVYSQSLGFWLLCEVSYNEMRGSIPTGENMLILLICAFVLLLAISSAFFVTNRISKPIKKLERNLNSAENKLRQRKKEQQLAALLTQPRHDGSQIKKLLGEMNSPFTVNSRIFFIRICINHTNEIYESNPQENMLLNRYSVANVFAELIGEIVTVESMGENENTVILIADADLKERGKLFKRFEFGRKILEEQLDFTVSIAVGSTYDIVDITQAYQEIIRLSELRYLLGCEKVITPDMMTNGNKPVGVERMTESFKEMLFGKNIKNAKQILMEIIKMLSLGSVDDARLQLLKLYIIISDFSNTVRSSYAQMEDITAQGIYADMSKSDTIQEAHQKLIMHLDYMDTFLKQQNIQYIDLVNRVKETIEKEYGDPDLCIDCIAKRIKISSFYLSKIFKKTTLKTIPEYLLNIRLTAACELLSETEMTVGEIIEKIGFTNASYFTAVFKKNILLTPSEYRKRH